MQSGIDPLRAPAAAHRGRFGWRHLLGFAGLAVLLTAAAAFAWYQYYLNASLFQPTYLSAPEQQILETKLSLIEFADSGGTLEQRYGKADDRRAPSPLAPEPYSEEGASRQIELSEKELNSLVARDEEIARRVAIDLSDDLVSVKLLVPMEDDFPLVGGRTLRLNLGVTLGYAASRPVVALRGVSLGGVPLPNAWLGDLKNVNLVEQFGSEGGFWDLFARGVENIRVRDGHLMVQLKE